MGEGFVFGAGPRLILSQGIRRDLLVCGEATVKTGGQAAPGPNPNPEDPGPRPHVHAGCRFCGDAKKPAAKTRHTFGFRKRQDTHTERTHHRAHRTRSCIWIVLSTDTLYATDLDSTPSTPSRRTPRPVSSRPPLPHDHPDRPRNYSTAAYYYYPSIDCASQPAQPNPSSSPGPTKDPLCNQG